MCCDELLLLFALRGSPLGYPFQFGVQTVKVRDIHQSGWVGPAGDPVGGIVFHSWFVDNYNVILAEEFVQTAASSPWISHGTKLFFVP